MKLERLKIDRLPGISDGFALDGLSPCINLVTGPNAMGKSSLVRALRLLLREPGKDDPPVSLTAAFHDGTSTWRVERTGRQVEWWLNGQVIARPALPSADQVGRYCLSMEDLISADAADQALAQELLRSLRGGFDLGQARQKVGKRHGGNEEKALRAAVTALRQAERVSEDLRGQQDQLPALGQEIERAREAEEKGRRIKRAKQLLEAADERISLQGKLDGFPGNMNRLSGKESESLEIHQQRLEDTQTQIRTSRDALQRAHRELQRLGLAQTVLDEAGQDLASAERKLQLIEGLRQQLSHGEQQQVVQRARFNEATRALGGEGQPELNMEQLSKAEGFAESLVALRITRKELLTKIKIAGEAPTEDEFKRHESAIQALRDWLNEQTDPLPRRKSVPLLWSSLAFMFLAAMSAFLAPPMLLWIFLGLSALGICYLLWKTYGEGKGVAGALRKVVKSRYAETGFSPPTWRGAEVSARLKELESTLGHLTTARSRSEGTAQLQMELEDTQRLLKEKEQERIELAKLIGFDPAIPLTALDRFIRLVKDWDVAGRDLAVATEEIQRSKGQIDTAISQASSFLSRWQESAPSDQPIDLDRLWVAHNSLEGRLDKARQTSHEIQLAEEAITSLEGHLAEHGEDIEKLYQQAGLEEGDQQELFKRIGLLEDWKETNRQLVAASVRETQIRKDLEKEPKLCEIVDAQDAAKLDALLEEHQSLADGLEGQSKEYESISANIRVAEKGDSLQEAIARYSQALSDLEFKRDELLNHKATELLLNQVEEAYTAHHQPKVLSEAIRLFSQITSHNFELELSDQGEFKARDTRQSDMRSLEELSTGTRMQLLLAVRVAWIRQQESLGETLPLFLDEALTTSDEGRFKEVAKSLHELSVSGGVQVIYLSARHHERDLWRFAIGDHLHCVDLASLRGQDKSAQTPDFKTVPRPPIPRPEGDAQAYAEALGVPPIDPRRDSGEIHPFHLLRDDLELLHQLLEDRDIESCGQLQSLLELQWTGLASGDQDLRSRLLSRCEAARSWISAWRQGRGRSADAGDLQASEAFSDRFIQEAATLAASSEIQGDASRFLEALRGGAIKGFRSQKIDDLEAWLSEHGYLDERPVLSPAERRKKVLGVHDLEDHTKARDIGRCIDWLESALQQTK